MKKTVYAFIIMVFSITQSFAQTDAPLVIGGQQKGEPNATVEIISKGGTKGFMPPRLTSAQVITLTQNLTARSEGLTIFNIDTDCLQYWKGAKWSDCSTYSNAELTPDCASSTIKGTYSLDKAVSDNEYIELKIDVKKAGPFSFSSDSKNGVRFYLTTILETGVQTIQIPAVGTPKAVGDFTYNLFDQAGNTICAANTNFKTTVVDNKANFTIKCTETAIVGNFHDDVAADIQTLVVKVAVSTAGNYFIKTDTVNGLWFEGSGNVNFGTTEIILNAKGVANTVAGDTGIRTFTLQDKDGVSLGCTATTSLMAAKAVFSVNCNSVLMEGTDKIFIPDYVFRDVDKLTVSINVTRTGPISLFTDPDQPVGYSYTGNIDKTGVQTITLLPTKTALNYHGPWDSTGQPRMFFTLKFFNFGTDTSCSLPLFYRIWDYVSQYKFLNTLVPTTIQTDPLVFDNIKLFAPISAPIGFVVPINFTSQGMINCKGTAAGLTIQFSGTGGGDYGVTTFSALKITGTLTSTGLITFPMYDQLTGKFLGGFTINFKG